MTDNDIHGRPLPESPSAAGPISPALAGFLRQGWSMAQERPSASPVASYTAKRRNQLSAAFPGETLVIPSGIPKPRANDTDYPFRPGSDFFWLTGCVEPEAVVILSPEGDGHNECLYVPRTSDRRSLDFFRDRRHGELWVGKRLGVDRSSSLLGIECAPLDALESLLGDLVDGRPLRVLRGLDPWIDARIPLETDADLELGARLSELRLVKDEYEVAALEEAAAITSRGFEDVRVALPQALQYGERWIEGTFWRRARAEGNDVGYTSICASGSNATVLHWTHNDGPVRPGDLLLLDMGVETRSLYTADITRTMPVSGSWSPPQREVYEAVLAAQEAGLAAVRPGAAFTAPNEAAQAVLAEALASWGILPTSAEESLQPDAGFHRRYTLHGVSHMLGIDVHDCAKARTEHYLEGVLEAGHVLTVEPGLYFQPDDLTVPEAFRGIGIRIEDDVVVTDRGAHVLSHHLPRDPDEVLAWLGA